MRNFGKVYFNDGEILYIGEKDNQNKPNGMGLLKFNNNNSLLICERFTTEVPFGFAINRFYDDNYTFFGIQKENKFMGPCLTIRDNGDISYQNYSLSNEGDIEGFAIDITPDGDYYIYEKDQDNTVTGVVYKSGSLYFSDFNKNNELTYNDFITSIGLNYTFKSKFDICKPFNFNKHLVAHNGKNKSGENFDYVCQCKSPSDYTLEGFGAIRWDNISYIGEWDKSLRNGLGIYRKNNNVYIGTFTNNIIDGTFIIYYKDNYVEIANFKDGVKEGVSFVISDSQIALSYYENNKIVGKRFLILSGCAEVCEFIDNEETNRFVRGQ